MTHTIYNSRGAEIKKARNTAFHKKFNTVFCLKIISYKISPVLFADLFHDYWTCQWHNFTSLFSILYAIITVKFFLPCTMFSSFSSRHDHYCKTLTVCYCISLNHSQGHLSLVFSAPVWYGERSAIWTQQEAVDIGTWLLLELEERKGGQRWHWSRHPPVCQQIKKKS